MISHEENFQSLRVGAEQKADFQSCPAFKYILPQAPDGDPRVKVWLAEAVGQDSQCSLHPAYIGVAQVFKPALKAATEQDGGFSHVSACQ